MNPIKGPFAALVLALALSGCGPAKEFHSMALHELGHVAGRTHSQYPTSIMYPFVGAGKRLSPDDLLLAAITPQPMVCFSASTLELYYQDKLHTAFAEWNAATRYEWLSFSQECINTITLGTDTNMHAAYTHPGYPIRIVFSEYVDWF